MFIFVWLLIPETKGLSLEQMDELFGVTYASETGDADRNASAERVQGMEKHGGATLA
jgi:hypothetical protein